MAKTSGRPGYAALRRTPDGVLWLTAACGAVGGDICGEVADGASWARIGSRFTAAGGELPAGAGAQGISLGSFTIE